MAVTVAAMILLLGTWSCTGPGVPSEVEDDLSVPGFELNLGPKTTTEVLLGELDANFEDTPGVVQAPTALSPEGLVSSISSICASAELPLRDVTARRLGSWLSYAVKDSEGRCVATHQGDPRDGPSPPQLALESALASWVGTAIVNAPDERFEQDGVTYYPPEGVTVRGVAGIYVREEGPGNGDERPWHHIIWLEDEAYWHLMGLAEGASGDPGRYDLEALLNVANSLRDLDGVTTD